MRGMRQGYDGDAMGKPGMRQRCAEDATGMQQGCDGDATGMHRGRDTDVTGMRQGCDGDAREALANSLLFWLTT